MGATDPRDASSHANVDMKLEAVVIPGAALNLLVVSDVDAAHDDLAGKGVDGSEVFHDASGGYNRFDPALRASGPDPQRRNWRAWYAEYMVAEQTGNELPS